MTNRRAEYIKEQGNVAFKAGKYAGAVDLYGKAIGRLIWSITLVCSQNFSTESNPLEPCYFTSRAAAYIALRRFRPALEDCQVAASLQSSSPSPKTLLRLARCQLALGSSTPALSTIGSILTIEPNNTQAVQLRDVAHQLENHVKDVEQARQKKNWVLSQYSLNKCLDTIEGKGGEVPLEWRYWQVELELIRGNWEAADKATK
jgi:DnaJ family protein C protein 7